MGTSNLSSGNLSKFSVLKEMENFSRKSKRTENYSMKEAYQHWIAALRMYCVQAPMTYVRLKHRLCIEVMVKQTAYMNHSQVRRAMCRDESCSSHQSLGFTIFEWPHDPECFSVPKFSAYLHPIFFNYIPILKIQSGSAGPSELNGRTS